MPASENFHTLLGFDLLEWREGFPRLALDVTPRHLNGSGIIHGGLLMTMLDEAGALCGLHSDVPGQRRVSVTVDLDCRFVEQANRGRVFATGECISHGRSLYFTRVEVRDAEGRVLAYGASTHKWRRGSRPAEAAPQS